MPRKKKMVQVRMTSIVAGPERSGKPGDILTVDEKTAKAWDGKYAVIISGNAPAKPETAMTAAPENAMEPAGEARKGIAGTVKDKIGWRGPAETADEGAAEETEDAEEAAE